jgi:hypothetical protein
MGTRSSHHRRSNGVLRLVRRSAGWRLTGHTLGQTECRTGSIRLILAIGKRLVPHAIPRFTLYRHPRGQGRTGSTAWLEGLLFLISKLLDHRFLAIQKWLCRACSRVGPNTASKLCTVRTCAVEAIEGMQQYQFAQTQAKVVELRVLLNDDFGDASRQALLAALRPVLPGVAVSIRTLRSVPSQPSGKYRIVKSELVPPAGSSGP